MNKKQGSLIQELHQQLDNQSQINNPIFYLIFFCKDATWFNKKFSNAYILLDNHHFIIRYRNNSNGNDKARHALFMKEIFKIIIGEPRIPIRLGESICEVLSMFIIKFSKVKSQLPSSIIVISSAFKQCHEIQKKHFTNCLNPFLKYPHLIMDFFGWNLLQCGTSRNKDFWPHFQASFSKVVSLSFGDSFANILICGWNFNQDLQFNAQWSYISILTMHILLIQKLAFRSKDNLSSQNEFSSMFQLFLLLAYDCNLEFGMTKSFKDAIPNFT